MKRLKDYTDEQRNQISEILPSLPYRSPAAKAFGDGTQADVQSVIQTILDIVKTHGEGVEGGNEERSGSGVYYSIAPVTKD